jgi:hypothetical protein
MDRGQTLHDYVAGISVFVLTVALVLGLLPSVVAPFQDGTGAVDGTISNRIGERVVSNLSQAGTPNVLDADELGTLLAKDESDLRDRFGLASAQYVNLSLRSLNASAILTGPSGVAQTAGATAASEGARTSARVVRLDESGYDCRPACRLVVRVW